MTGLVITMYAGLSICSNIHDMLSSALLLTVAVLRGLGMLAWATWLLSRQLSLVVWRITQTAG